MNRPLVGIVVALLLFISLLLNLVFYGLWQQEKEVHISTKTELREAKLRLETSKKNSPEQLTKKAEEFALTLLTYDKEHQSERKKRLLSLMSKGLGTKLLETKKEVSGEHIEGDNIISSAKITGQLNQATSHKLTITVFGIFNNKGYDVSVNQVIEGQANFDNKPLKLLDSSQTGKAEVFYTFTASKAGGYETAEMLEVVQKYMSHLSAKEVEKLVEKNFVSISAYSPSLNNSLSLEDGRKMNLQVAMRSLNNKTTLTIESPIITTEY